MTTTPSQPGNAAPGGADVPLEKQLDALLMQIETAEPGTLDPHVLPPAFRTQLIMTKAAEAAGQAQAEDEAQAQDQAEPTPAPPADDAPTAPPQAQAATESSEPAGTADESTPEQADMLAALNSALQGLSGDTPTEQTPAPPAEDNTADAPPPADEPAEPLSMEDKLQQEIAALMGAGPQATPEPQAPDTPTQEQAEPKDDLASVLEASLATPDSPATENDGPAAPAEAAIEDQIANEIEGLLATDQAQTDTATQTDAPAAQDNTPIVEPIDELDKMLANEIDADDELAGDFQTVEDITAGIQIDDSQTLAVDDEHAATARDVAAELDSQPEDLPTATPPEQATDEDPMAVLADLANTAEENEQQNHAHAALDISKWENRLDLAKEHLLNACYLINWPARRFLTTEWRANLGYIALLNLFFGVGFWLVLILF